MAFRWRLGSYVGGDYAVKPNYKNYLILRPSTGSWASGVIEIQPRDTSTITRSLGFEPNVLIMVSYRPKYAGGTADSNFGNRGGGMTFGVAGPDAQFTGSTRIKQGFDFHIGMARWREDVCFNVVHGGYPSSWESGTTDFDALTLTHVFTSTGFELTPTLNLYDQEDPVYWLAMDGNFKVGVFDMGDTSITGAPWKPEGAAFFSVRTTGDYSQPPSEGSAWSVSPRPTPDPWHVGYWQHMRGFASIDGQNCIVGGAKVTSWNWTTDYFSDRSALIMLTAASSSGFVGAAVEQEGRVSAWWEDVHSVTITRSGGTATVADTGHGFITGQQVQIRGANQSQYNGIVTITVTDADHYTYAVSGSPATPATGTITSRVGGIDLQYDTFNGIPYRVGYILADTGEASYLEANFEKRPGGSQADADGNNTVLTRVDPRVILMSSTNYNFSMSDFDPLSQPRTINGFGFAGSGGFAWHWSENAGADWDSYGVGTYGNAVAERGHYSNAGSIRTSVYGGIAPAGSSNPPAYPEHSIHIIGSPLIVGTNWRVDADRRVDGTGRGHVAV